MLFFLYMDAFGTDIAAHFLKCQPQEQIFGMKKSLETGRTTKSNN
jgi:hypothetical protein